MKEENVLSCCESVFRVMAAAKTFSRGGNVLEQKCLHSNHAGPGLKRLTGGTRLAAPPQPLTNGTYPSHVSVFLFSPGEKQRRAGSLAVAAPAAPSCADGRGGKRAGAT